VSIVLKPGNLSILEPSGSVKACNGIAVPLPFTSDAMQHIEVTKRLYIAKQRAVLSSYMLLGYSYDCGLSLADATQILHLLYLSFTPIQDSGVEEA
jgi:hypothetical protein